MLLYEQTQLWLPQSISQSAFMSNLSDFCSNSSFTEPASPSLCCWRFGFLCVFLTFFQWTLRRKISMCVWSLIGKPSFIRKLLNVWTMEDHVLLCVSVGGGQRRGFSLRNYECAKVDFLDLGWKWGAELLRTFFPQISHCWRKSHTGGC